MKYNKHAFFYILDLLRKYFRREIWKLQQKNIYAVGLLLIIFTVAFFGTAASATDAANPDLPVKEIRQVTFDETRSILFIVNEDSTVSAYDAAQKNFILVQKTFPGLRNVRTITVSPNGSFIGLVSRDRTFTSIHIFKVDNLLADRDVNPTANYVIESETDDGISAGRFSADEQFFFFIAGKNTVFVLNTANDEKENNIFKSAEKRKEKITVGDIPIAMDMDSSGHLFILNQKSENVSIIDVAKKTVTTTVPVGSFPKNIIFNNITKKAYVSHIGSDDVYVIDPLSASVMKKITIGGDPIGLAYDQKTGDVFVGSNSSGIISIISPKFNIRTVDLGSPAYLTSTPLSLRYMQNAHTLFILNKSTARLFAYDTVTSRIVNEQKTGLFPTDIVGSEKLNLLFLIRSHADSFAIVDAHTFAATHVPEDITSEQLFFSRPQSIAVDEKRNRIFISNLDNDIITVIDGNTHKPIAKIAAVSAPQVISFNPTNGKLYATSPVDNVVAVIDTLQQDYPIKIIPVGNQPRVLYINKLTDRIYVTNAGDSTVHVIDGERDEDILTIPLPSKSFPLLVQGDETANKIYVNLYGSGQIAIINGMSNTIEKYIPVGQNPLWLRPIPSAKRLIASVEGDKKIAIIDTEKNEMIQMIPVSGVPYRIFFDERTSYIYVNFRRENKVAVIAPDASFSHFTLLKEMPMLYWGQTDARPYNMAFSNTKTNLVYFTNGRDNRVVVVEDTLDEKGIKNSTLRATILANGEVIVPVTIQEQLGIGWYIGGGIILFVIGSLVYGIFKKRSV